VSILKTHQTFISEEFVRSSHFHLSADPFWVLVSSRTTFRQEAQITVSGVNVASLRTKIEDICVTNFEKNSEKGLQGLLQVVEAIRQETVGLAELAQTTLTGVANLSASAVDLATQTA